MRIKSWYHKHRIPLAAVLALILSAYVQPLPGQTGTPEPAPISLRDALRQADRHAFPNRQAVATNSAEQARARLPLKGLLPSARVELGLVRTTDPIGAFGTTLRQRRVTPEAFEPARLNDPAAVSNVQSAIVVEVPMFNADALAALRAARSGADATSAAREWTAITTRANVIRAYFAAVLASEKNASLETARFAAEAAVRQVRAMMTHGLVSKADVLQADVRAADVASQLIAARDDAQNARQQLGLLLGRTALADFLVPAELPSAATLRVMAAGDTLAPIPNGTNGTMNRADIRAARAGAEAANADRGRARGTLLPRVNSFARYDWNSPTAVAGGRKNWTVGVVGSWTLSSGGSEIADVRGASARAAGAMADEEALRAQSLVEASAAQRGVSVALERMQLAERAAEQSREAHRLVDKRYGGGLATIAELLGAEASATGAVLGLAAARYNVIDAMVTHRQAIGADPAALSELDTARGGR